jgi:hypothetical protein
MANSTHKDIVNEVLERTIDNYQNSGDDHAISAKALREGIKDGKLKDAQWVLQVLGSDLDPASGKGDIGEDKSPGDS